MASFVVHLVSMHGCVLCLRRKALEPDTNICMFYALLNELHCLISLKIYFFTYVSPFIAGQGIILLLHMSGPQRFWNSLILD